MTRQVDQDVDALTKCRSDLVGTPSGDVSNQRLISSLSGHRADCYGEVVRESIWDIGVGWVAVNVNDVS